MPGIVRADGSGYLERINVIFHLWSFEIKLSHGMIDALVFWHQVKIASPVVRFISEIKPARFLWNI
jgi:hypothetical protein